MKGVTVERVTVGWGESLERGAHGDTPSVGPPGPALVWCFPRGRARSAWRSVPRSGVVLGRGRPVFGEPFGDATLSDEHAKVTLRPGNKVSVRDLGSRAGTRVNGEPLVGERELRPGDVLRLGDTLVVLVEAPPSEATDVGELVGSSAAMTAVRRGIDAVARRGHAVVITGETGTGKEVVARRLHERSGRAGPFLAVNCSTLSGELLSSELFGHVKGAFTGATCDHPGLFRAARGGTLLLDELADLPMNVQAQLLRVLETRSVRPVGGTRDVEIDVRVAATTNRELADLVRLGRFRADLYARLAQWTVRTPRLAERREDLPELVASLLPRVDGSGRRISTDLAEALLAHAWPLNVRGLQNILSIAVICAPPDGPLELGREVVDALAAAGSLAAPLAQELPATASNRPEPAEWSPPVVLDREELEALMVRFRGHVAAASRHLGITRPSMYRMLSAHGLRPEPYRTPRRDV